jgi:hypothetical protein
MVLKLGTAGSYVKHIKFFFINIFNSLFIRNFKTIEFLSAAFHAKLQKVKMEKNYTIVCNLFHTRERLWINQ